MLARSPRRAARWLPSRSSPAAARTTAAGGRRPRDGRRHDHAGRRPRAQRRRATRSRSCGLLAAERRPARLRGAPARRPGARRRRPGRALGRRRRRVAREAIEGAGTDAPVRDAERPRAAGGATIRTGGRTRATRSPRPRELERALRPRPLRAYEPRRAAARSTRDAWSRLHRRGPRGSSASSSPPTTRSATTPRRYGIDVDRHRDPVALHARASRRRATPRSSCGRSASRA